MTNGGLANHLADQVTNTVRLLAAEPSELPPIPVVEHYRRASWDDVAAQVYAIGNNRTAAVIIFDLSGNEWQLLAAFGVVMFVLLIALVTVAHILSKRFGIKE